MWYSSTTYLLCTYFWTYRVPCTVPVPCMTHWFSTHHICLKTRTRTKDKLIFEKNVFWPALGRYLRSKRWIWISIGWKWPTGSYYNSIQNEYLIRLYEWWYCNYYWHSCLHMSRFLISECHRDTIVTAYSSSTWQMTLLSISIWQRWSRLIIDKASIFTSFSGRMSSPRRFLQ